MGPLALALHLALASPGLVPPLDPGPFQGSELAAASAGVFVGDVLVVGAGYLTLQLFARDVFDPSAANFRRAAYGLAATALILPPLTSVLLARWVRAEPASGSFWKALLLTTLGNAAAITAGILAAPNLWVILPVQVVMMAVGATVGLHWGPRSHRAPTAMPSADAAPTPSSDAEMSAPSHGEASHGEASAICPDPALATARATPG